MGGVYRDQGLEVVSKWLMSLFSSPVKAAFKNVRKDHLLPPLTDVAECIEHAPSTMAVPSTPTLEFVRGRKIDWEAIIGPSCCIDSPVTTQYA